MKLPRLYVVPVTMLSFGYPLTAALATMFGLSINEANYMLKTVWFALSGMALMLILAKGKHVIPKATSLFLIFFILYGLRLLIDVLGFGIVAETADPRYVLGYFFGLSMLPAITIGLSAEPSHLPIISKWIGWVLLLSCVSILALYAQSGGAVLQSIADQRFELRQKGESVAVLNPIVVGMAGCLLVTFSISQLIGNLKLAGGERLRILVGVPIGLVVLLLGGSRGPLLAFGVAGFLVLSSAMRLGLLRSSISGNRLNRNIILITFAVAIAALIFQMSRTGSSLAISRFAETASLLASGDADEIRLLIAKDALSGFVTHPIFGKSYMALDGTAYAHNSIIEAFMSTGLVGGIVFLSCFITFLRMAWSRTIQTMDPYLFSLATISVALGFLSLSSMTLSQSPEIWLPIVLFVTLCSRTQKNENS